MPAPRSHPSPETPVLADASVAVRPARMDRQLVQGRLPAGYADERLEEIVADAAEQARVAARAEGYAAGWSQGRQVAAEEARAKAAEVAAQVAARKLADQQRVQRLLDGLGAAVRQVQQTAAPEWSELAEVLVDGAMQLAQSVIGRELRAMDDRVADAVRVSLQKIADPQDAVVHLNPDDVPLLGDDTPQGVRVVADPSVPVGAAVTMTATQRLRIDLPAAIATAERVLRS